MNPLSLILFVLAALCFLADVLAWNGPTREGRQPWSARWQPLGLLFLTLAIAGLWLIETSDPIVLLEATSK